jgi:hypothetical protein
LAGFTDAEGNFYINLKSDSRVSFRFEIHLHVDDTLLLNKLCEKLGIGEVYTSKDKSTFVVSKLNEIEQIIEIFTEYPLNTIKLLNFIDFAKAYGLYINRKNSSASVMNEITNLKCSMNSNRTDFTMPVHYNPKITPY